MKQLTLGHDSQYYVRVWVAVDIWRVSDGACVGSIIIQRWIDQRDGGFALCRASSPLNTPTEVAFQRREGTRREVEELKEGEKEATIIMIPYTVKGRDQEQ